jgi:ADP-heptose:LPS heptosyltransferase
MPSLPLAHPCRGLLTAEAPPRNVVVFRALHLGDLLCAVPALRALRRALPASRITLLGLPSAARFAARFHAYLDDFAPFVGYPGLPEMPTPEPADLFAFFAAMREQRFDLALQLHGSGRVSNGVVRRLSARRVAGYHPEGTPCPDPATFLPYPEGEHEIRRNLALVEFLGARAAGRDLEFPLTDADLAEAHALPGVAALVPGTYACLHPGARSANKRWPPERFAAIGNALHAAGLDVVLTGSTQETGITRAVAAEMHRRPLDTAGPVSIGGLAAIVAGARLVVCNDTGVSHIAAALRVPSVVIFFATDPRRWAPLDRTRHRVVARPGDVPPEPVLRACQALLARYA